MIAKKPDELGIFNEREDWMSNDLSVDLVEHLLHLLTQQPCGYDFS